MAAAKFPENSLIKPRYRWAHRQVDSARGGATCRVARDCQLSVSAGTVGDNKCDNWSQESLIKIMEEFGLFGRKVAEQLLSNCQNRLQS